MVKSIFKVLFLKTLEISLRRFSSRKSVWSHILVREQGGRHRVPQLSIGHSFYFWNQLTSLLAEELLSRFLPSKCPLKEGGDHL